MGPITWRITRRDNYPLGSYKRQHPGARERMGFVDAETEKEALRKAERAYPGMWIEVHRHRDYAS